MTNDDELNRLAFAVADTLVVRRDAEKQITCGTLEQLPKDSPHWNKLLVSERDARITNDKELAAYRAAKEQVKS